MTRFQTFLYWLGRIPAILLDLPWDWPTFQRVSEPADAPLGGVISVETRADQVLDNTKGME